MNKEDANKTLSGLSDAQLRIELQKRKSLLLAFTVIMLALLGFAVYNATHRGAMIFSVMPLIFSPVFIGIQKNYGAARLEMKSRSLE